MKSLDELIAEDITDVNSRMDAVETFYSLLIGSSRIIGRRIIRELKHVATLRAVRVILTDVFEADR